MESSLASVTEPRYSGEGGQIRSIVTHMFLLFRNAIATCKCCLMKASFCEFLTFMHCNATLITLHQVTIFSTAQDNPSLSSPLRPPLPLTCLLNTHCIKVSQNSELAVESAVHWEIHSSPHEIGLNRTQVQLTLTNDNHLSPLVGELPSSLSLLAEPLSSCTITF